MIIEGREVYGRTNEYIGCGALIRGVLMRDIILFVTGDMSCLL